MQNCKFNKIAVSNIIDKTLYRIEVRYEKNFSSDEPNVVSLSGINDDAFMKECIEMHFICLVNSHLLGLLKIKSLRRVTSGVTFVPTQLTTPELSQKFHKALEIIDNHLRGDRDILSCQEQLIEAGLKDYAKF